ncbi:hypothetical protein H6776_02655 [Candidatus Nomurabacteria bacterium]|nr:hypothetical protein [Candidatus Nomurabacteria bacterium]
MKNLIPKQPIVLVIALAIVATIILVLTQIKLIQKAPLADSQDIVQVLQEKFPYSTIHEDILDPGVIVLVYNGQSEQCKRAIRFVESLGKKYPEYRTTIYVIDGNDYLHELSKEETCWVNTELTEQWLIYPTIFFEDQVFVGYGPGTKWEIKKMLREKI